jgi:hypothetical protein
MDNNRSWPEKTELIADIQKILKTLSVEMFVVARELTSEICIFNKTGVRYTIQEPCYELSRECYPVIEWGIGSLSNSRDIHLFPSKWELLTWLTQKLLYKEIS